MIKEKKGDSGYLRINRDIIKVWEDPYNIYTFGNVKMVFGTVSVKTTSASASSATFPYYGYKAITFPAVFNNAPYVVSNVCRHYAYWNSNVTGITKTGCNVWVAGDVNNSTSTVWVLAIGT